LTSMTVQWKNTCELKLLKGLECHKDTQMKAHDITKLTAELKSADILWYRYKIRRILLTSLFSWVWLPEAHTIKVNYLTRIVGRTEVTVRFMN